MSGLVRCSDPGCPGRVQDGYCDTCGLPPAPPPAATSNVPASPASSAGIPVPYGVTAGHSGSTSGPSRRGMLGAGLVEIPPVPYRDPATAIMADPQVPENKRYCGGCDAPVGRGRGGRPGRTEGFCARCGARFSFTPKLSRGDLVGGQYEVLGCLAHGGLGWIYLARDRNVSDRWVVLKGLLDSGDPDAMAAAVAERRFLAEVEHPNVVKIYNFVRHAGSGYIVMEYVGGRSLKDILLERRRDFGESLPLPQVIAYGLEVLRALGHLHDLGLVFCDFKPDNAVQTGEQLRLIDLGGVRPIDEVGGPIYGTVGYQAPEIADEGPSVSSDLYTVARSMAVLSFDFTGYTGKYEFSLPPRKDVDVLARHGSFDRLLRRATHPDPAERFSSAAEMADQLTGVLREVLAGEDGRPRPAVSGLFGPEVRVVGTRGAAPPEAAEMMAALPLPLGDGADWRKDWDLALSEKDLELAAHGFESVYGRLPGEAAPKLGLAACAELRGEYSFAAHFYGLVWRTDRSYVGAAFGLARARLAQGDRAGAVEALASVPATSSHYVDAQVGAALARLRGRDPRDLREEELVEASGRIEGVVLDPERRGRLAVLLLESALARVLLYGASGTGARVLNARLNERELRAALEREYRELARLAHDAAGRLALVDRANAVRPKTMV